MKIVIKQSELESLIGGLDKRIYLDEFDEGTIVSHISQIEIKINQTSEVEGNQLENMVCRHSLDFQFIINKGWDDKKGISFECHFSNILFREENSVDCLNLGKSTVGICENLIITIMNYFTRVSMGDTLLENGGNISLERYLKQDINPELLIWERKVLL